MTSKQINKYVDSFLHNLKITIKEAANLLPDNPNLYRANKRIGLVIQYEPKIVIDKVGEMLFKYKDFVYDATTEELLLQWNFSEDIKTLDEPDDADLATLIICELKLCIQKLDECQKMFFRKQICDLLDDYLEYKVLSCTK